MKTIEMELKLVSYLDYRRNLIVPNVHWGLNMHECDLLLLTQSGYATEIEIKISMADLRRDKHKAHGHRSGGRIKKLYFALPAKLKEKHLEEIEALVPERAGIYFVYDDDERWCPVRVHREAVVNNNARKFTDDERYRMARLGALRIWNLKRKTL